MKLSLYETPDVFETLRTEWNDLVNRSTADCIFSTWEWASAWWQAYQPGRLWVVTCRDEEGRLTGIAPWFIAEDPEAGRVLRCIGCIDVTDYLDIITDRDHVGPVLQSLAAFLAENTDAFDAISLCNIPENSPTFHEFPHMLQNCGFTTSIKQLEVCPVITLPDSWEAYLEQLNKKQRHEIRRKLRRAADSTDEIDWYTVDETQDLDEQMGIFMRLMAASTPEKAAFLDDPQHRAFFTQIVPLAAKNGWLHMVFLTVRGQQIAGYLNFDYKGRIMVYNSGLDPVDYGHLSPGIVLLAHDIRHAIEKGRQVYDFLRGDEVYKYRMGAQDTAVYGLNAQFMPQG